MNNTGVFYNLLEHIVYSGTFIWYISRCYLPPKASQTKVIESPVRYGPTKVVRRVPVSSNITTGSGGTEILIVNHNVTKQIGNHRPYIM